MARALAQIIRDHEAAKIDPTIEQARNAGFRLGEFDKTRGVFDDKAPSGLDTEAEQKAYRLAYRKINPTPPGVRRNDGSDRRRHCPLGAGRGSPGGRAAGA